MPSAHSHFRDENKTKHVSVPAAHNFQQNTIRRIRRMVRIEKNSHFICFKENYKIFCCVQNVVVADHRSLGVFVHTRWFFSTICLFCMSGAEIARNKPPLVKSQSFGLPPPPRDHCNRGVRCKRCGCDWKSAGSSSSAPTRVEQGTRARQCFQCFKVFDDPRDIDQPRFKKGPLKSRPLKFDFSFPPLFSACLRVCKKGHVRRKIGLDVVSVFVYIGYWQQNAVFCRSGKFGVQRRSRSELVDSCCSMDPNVINKKKYV